MHCVTHLNCGKNEHGETMVWDNYGRIVENVRAMAICASMIDNDADWTVYFVMVNAEDQESYLHGVRRLAREKVMVGERELEFLFRTEFDMVGFPGVQMMTLRLADDDIITEVEYIAPGDDVSDPQ